MVQAKSQKRVVLKIVERRPGQFVLRKCEEMWVQMPFVWPSQSSLEGDLTTIKAALAAKGYDVSQDETVLFVKETEVPAQDASNN
jgi:hypothetical protein